MSVRPKKHLGQHFLKDEEVAKKIADSLTLNGYRKVLEIGPGMGVLTKYLVEKDADLSLIELDHESVDYLKAHYLPLRDNIIEADFLKWDPLSAFGDEQFAIIGNFPYNISSQIIFSMLGYKQQVPELVGMFQKEVAERISEKEGSKTYGILSVLTQAYYDAEYLFTVPPTVFNPPPKVESGVIRLTRKSSLDLGCDESLFTKVVKTSFNQRRKTLRNSLKTFNLSDNLKPNGIFGKRPEQLSVKGFIELTRMISNDC